VGSHQVQLFEIVKSFYQQGWLAAPQAMFARTFATDRLFAKAFR